MDKILKMLDNKDFCALSKINYLCNTIVIYCSTIVDTCDAMICLRCIGSKWKFVRENIVTTEQPVVE